MSLCIALSIRLGCDAIGGSADRFTEIFWCKVEYICIELDLSRLPIVFYHQLAEAVEDVCMSVDYPSAVLIAAVVIEKLMLTACLSPCDLSVLVPV